MNHNDTLIYFGGEVKALDGSGRVGGYLVCFGDEAHPDLSAQRDYFTPETDFGLEDGEGKSLVWYHHNLPEVKGEPNPLAGRTLTAERASLKVQDAGVWMEGQLRLRDDYEKRVWDLVQAGKVGLSSGTAGHLVRREKQPGGAHKVLAWPLGLDASLTPTPAEPRTAALAIKSLEAVKGEALGPNAGISAAMSALGRLSELASYRITSHMEDRTRPRTERLAACKACLDEYQATAVKILEALMDGDDGPTNEGALKALVQAAVTGFPDRLAARRDRAIRDAERLLREEFLRVEARFAGRLRP